MPDISLSWPVALPRITQVFGGNAALYHRWGLRGHNGIDFGVAVGTPVMACDDGVVAVVRNDPAGYGLHVKLRHRWGFSLYAHLDACVVDPGQVVARGEAIATSGNSGFSTGPHLHFGVQVAAGGRVDRGNGWHGYTDPMLFLPPVG